MRKLREVSYVGERRCYRCKITKPVARFAIARRKPLGRDYACKLCVATIHREKYYPKIKTTARHKEQHRLATIKYRQKYPEKALAHRLARKLKDELLKDSCENCGESRKLHMHHPDYSKPLEVITLCISCHEQIHHGVLV